MMSNELYHYGVKGQKWGVRRYQKKDGTLTPAGKRRQRADYASEARSMSDQELRSKIDRMRNEKRYIDMTKGSGSKLSKALNATNRATKMASDTGKINKDSKTLKGANESKADTISKGLNTVNKTASVLKRVDKIASDGKAVKRSKARLDKMTDNELRDAVNRMDLEQQYASLRKETVNRGRVTAQDIIEIAGDVLTVAASATALAVSIQKLRKGAG